MGQLVKESINNYDNGVREDSSLAPSYDKAAANRLINLHINKSNPTNTELAPINFGKSRFDKYVDLQYQPDRLKQQKQLEQLRGEEQSGIEQFGAALNQAIVGEVIGGTLEVAGYYGQLLQGKANVVDGAGMNYHNGLSQAGKAIREWAEENTPIYQAADPDGSMLQDMTHWSWYMKQLPSVASAASLLLPGLGAVKLVGGIGKILQLVDKFTKVEKVIGASLLQATVSRYGENAMEAGNNWDETYNKYIQQGANEKDAILAANKAAEYTFKANWAMLTQDIASALFMNIPGTKAATANGLKTAKAMGVDIAPVMVKDLGKRVLSASGEGLEEAYQYIASEEGKHYADMQMNPDNKKDSALSSRFGKYIQSKDLWTSALFGAIGGGVTEFAFDKLSGEQRIDENKARQIQEMPNIIRKMYDSQYEAEQIGTESAKKATKLNNIADLATNASTLGNMDNIKTIMSSMKSMSPEEYSKILGEGVSNEEIAEFQKNINDNLRHLDTFKSLYEKYAKTKEPEIAANLARVSFLKDNYNKERVNTKAAIDSLGVDLWSNFKDLTDNNGNVVGLTNSINNYLQNNFVQKSSKNTVTFFENKLKKDKDLTDEQKKTYTDLINEHKKISNDALIDNKTIYAEMTTSEKEGLNKLGKEGTDVFNEIVQKKTSLSFIDASLKTFDKQLSVLNKVNTVEEYNNTVNKTTKSAIENIVKEKEAQRKKDLEEQQLAKVAEEAAKAAENNELAKVEEVVDKISNGEKIEDPELLQVQANNPNLVEQGLKDKAKEEVANKIKDEQAIDPVDTEIKQDIQEPIESVEAEEKETAPEELEVTEQITETPVIDTLLENNKLTERKFETTLQGQIYVHDILWFDPAADYTGKNGWVDAPNSELVKLLQDPNVNLEDIKFSGKFQTFGSNEDVDTLGIAYNFKLGGKKFAFYVKDATYDNLKDKFVGREDQIETALTELRVQRALILNEINKAKEDVAKGNIAFVKPVSISLSNGIPNFTQVYTNVQDVFNNLFKKLFGEKDGKLDYNGINTSKVHFGIGYNFGTILNSKMERIHNANVTNKGALYMVIPGSEMSGKQDEAVRLNVPYLKDIQFGGNKLSEVLLYTLLEGVYYNQESLKLRKNGLSQQVPNSSFKYVSLLKLFSNYGVSNTVSDFNIEYEENKPVLILNGKRYNVASLVTTTNNVVRQEVLDILDSKLLQVSLKKLDSSLKEALGFKNKQWDARWGDSINIPFVDITLSKDEFENMSYIGFLMSKNLIKTNLDKQQPFKAPYVYFQGVETVKPVKNYTKIVTEAEKPDTAKPVVKQVIVKTAEKPDVAKVVKPNKAANIFANSVGLGIKPKSDTKLNSLVSKEPFIQGNIDEATVWLADKLNIKPNVTQGLINVSHLGLKAYGTFSKDGITLSTQLSKGTEYHEAFHRVSLLLLTDSERELLHKEVTDIYGITGDLTTREEWLAEAFKKYVLFGELPNKIDKKQSIISKVFNWFLSLFKSNRKLNNSQVYNIFKGIQEGTYKNTKEQRTFDDINKLFNTDNTTLLTEVDGVTFNYIRSAGQFEEVVNNIFITTLSLNNVNAIKGSVIDLDFNKTKDLLEQARNAFIEDGADAQVGFYNEIIDNFELFKNRVENELKAINFKKQRVEEEDLDKEQSSTDVTGESIAEHTKVSYEINPQENALAEIKVFLKTLPQVERTEMGELVAVTDEFSGMLKPIVYGKIWNQLMDDLHGIKSIEGHIQALNNKANVIPIYEYIASKLSSMPDQFKTQWLVTFNKHKHAMTNTLYTIDTKYGPKMELVDGEMQSTGFEIVDETVTFRQGDANIQKPEKFYVKDWGNAFLNSELFIHEPNKKTEVNKEKLTEQISEFNIFVTSLNTRISSNRNFNIDIEIELNNLVEGLNAVGIKVDYNTMLHLLNDIDVSDNISKGIINKYNAVNQDGIKIAQLHKYLTRSTNNISYLFSNTLKELVDKGKVLTKNRELEFSDVFKNESAVAELARYYTKDNPIASQSTTLGPDGNAVYQYAPNSYLTDVVNDIKTDVEFKQSLFESVYSEGSYIANTIKEYNNTQLDKFNILTALNFIQDNSGDKGKGYLDMSPMEDYLFKMANIHNNQFIVPTLADKKPYFMFTGVPTILDKIIVGKEINFSDNVLNVFRNYFNSEIKAIKDAYNFYESNKDNPDKLVKNYHTYKSNKNGEGNGMRFRHFVDLNAYFENDELRKGKTVLEIAEALEKRYADQTVLDDMITKALKAVIKEEIKFASKIGLIEEFSEFKLGNLKNNYLDNNRFTTLKNEFGNNEGLAVYQMIAEFTINNVIAINEFERLVSKDPAFYKDRDDVIKRLSAITSTGDNLDTGAMKRTQYSSITLKDNEIPSAYTKVLHTRVYNALKDILGEDAATEQANKVVESYDSVNQTDAQVYISPNMYKDILKGLGEWDDATYGKAFDILENENWEGDPELTRQALNIVMQPLKMVHFGDYFMDNMDVPMYDKMSLACLFKSLVKGTDLQPLYDRMNNSTLGKVDMVKFESAVKVGLNKPFQYYKNSDMTEINDLNNVVTKTQDFKYLRRQLLTDPHHVDEAMLGTQVLKAAMSNINNEIGYNVAGTELKGSALKTEYIESMKALSNIGKKEMLEELGIEEKENGEYTINKPKLIEFLARDAKSSGLPYNITDALKVVGNEFLLELAAHPDAAWIESRFTSLVNKKIIDTFMPGNAFIQMSNFGLKDLGNKPVSRTSNDIRDLPSYGKNGELAFITEDGYMECAVSINLFSSVIPDYENKSFKESAKWLLDNLDLLAMGYRIPTQGLSSISALKVVKILPETTGDTIVLPAEFTKKTGSDFDIDKLYVARYNYKYNKRTDKVEKVQFNDFENAEDKWIRNSKAANQNRLLDCFMSVLTNPYHLNDTMMSLDRLTEILKKEILSDLEKGKIKEPVKTFTHASPQYQSNKKYEYTGGKTGIGPFALNNVHHVFSQMTDLKFMETEFLKRHNMLNVNKIVGEDGEKILDWLSTLINAHVDVAKDPYIIKLGVVSYTYNVTNLLLRTGKGASTFYFLPQPIIKDLAKAVNQLEGNIGVDKEKKQKDYEKEVLTKYFKELEKLTKTDQQKELTNKLKNWILKGEANTIDDRNLFDIDWLKETLQPSDTYKFYARQLLIGGTYLELEKNYAKPLGDLVMASRIDTKKFGNSVIMQRQFVKQMNDVLAANVFENASDLFEKTFLAEKAKLSIGYKDDIGTLRKIFKSFLISTTNPFIEAVDKIMTLSGRSISQDEVFVRNIAKNIKSNIFSEFFNESLKSSEQTYESMLYGDRSMAVRLDNLKKMISTDERLVDLKNNPLLDILNYDKVDSEIMDTPSLLTTPGSRISDKNSKDMVTLGWKDMLTFTHPDAKIEKAVQTFAKDLINYAWISSGSNPGPNSIYSYIPFDYLIDNGFNQFVKNKLESINNTDDLSEILTEESIESIYKNLWNNDNIVPLIKNEYIQLLNSKQTVKATSKIHGISYNKTLVFPLKLVRSLKLNTNGAYKPFIKVKINKDNVKDQVFTVLYKFAGVDQERDKKGNIREIPVYNAINKKGYFNKGKNIFEFNTLNNSTFAFNNVEEGSYIPYIEEPIIKVNDFNMTEEKSINTTIQKETINIYAGTNENKDLSNFAIRPFSIYVETNDGSKYFTFQSVEQGFHFYKSIIAENTIIGEKILKTTNGATLRKLTNRQNLQMTSEQIAEWDDTAKSIMLNLMYSSYQQNPNEAQKLINTKNAKITHTQDNTRWKNDFPEVVMVVRDMLKEEGFDKLLEEKKDTKTLLDSIKDITDEQANERKEQC